MSRPRLSIIIDNYNYGRFLGDAIDSALAQTYPDVEVIVVDDGSTDHSRDVIAAAGNRVVPILKANGGQASALNAGFARSTGDVILLLDADDMLLQTTGERVVAALAAQPEAAKVHYCLEVVDATGRPTGELKPRRPLSSGDLRRHVLEYPHHSRPPTSGSAFPRGTLSRLLPMPEEPYRTCVDNYLGQLAPLLGPVVALPQLGGRYRHHDSNHFLLRTEDRPTAARMRHRLLDYRRIVLRTRADQLRLAQELGLSLPRSRWPRSDAVFRLVSLKLDPANHPAPDETLWRIAWRSVNASLAGAHDPMSRWPKRLLQAGWCLVVAALPWRGALWLIGQTYFGSRDRGKAVAGWRRRQAQKEAVPAAISPGTSEQRSSSSRLQINLR